MKIEKDRARQVFKRAIAIQKMILEAQEDLRQLRADEIEELIPEGLDKALAKEIRFDLTEIIALAKIEARGEIEREKVAAKMAHRREVAEAVGMQLDTLQDESDEEMPPVGQSAAPEREPKAMTTPAAVSKVFPAPAIADQAATYAELKAQQPPAPSAVKAAAMPDDMPDIPAYLDRRVAQSAEAGG